MAKGQRLRAKSQEPKAKANCQLPFANCSLLQLASDSLGDGLERVRRAYILDHHGVEHEIRIAFAGDDAGHANFPFLNVAIPPRFIANATQSRDILLSWIEGQATQQENDGFESSLIHLVLGRSLRLLSLA